MNFDKKAERINYLTYELYRLQGFSNSKIIISYEDALKMTEDIVDKMIVDLEKEVRALRRKSIICPSSIINTSNKQIAEIRYISNFKKIKGIKITKENEHKKAEITTLNDKKIILNQENFLRKDNFKMDFKGLADIIKKSIDFDIEVNLYKAGAFDIVYLKNENKENLYKELSEVFNSLLKFNCKKLINNNLAINLKVLHEIVDDIKVSDAALYSRLNDILFDNQKLKEFLNIYKYARHFAYGLIVANEDVLYY